MILTIRTDKHEAEIGLFDGKKKLAYKTWQAHRQLAETIHQKLEELLSAQGRTLRNVSGIVVYQGPGSFTGLRISMSVGNALAYSLNVPITATTGDDWVDDGITKLKLKPSIISVVPEYGSAPHITSQRK